MYTCQNATLLEVTCCSSFAIDSEKREFSGDNTATVEFFIFLKFEQVQMFDFISCITS